MKNWFRNWVYDGGLKGREGEAEGCPVAPVFPQEVFALATTKQKVQVDITPEVRQLWEELRDHPKFRIAHFGAVGDAAHQKRKSCHNIVKNSEGRVIERAKALDIHPAGYNPKAKALGQSASYRAEGDAIAKFLVQNRSRYGITLVIWWGQKASAKSNWKWVPYNGASAHVDHVHASVNC